MTKLRPDNDKGLENPTVDVSSSYGGSNSDLSSLSDDDGDDSEEDDEESEDDDYPLPDPEWANSPAEPAVFSGLEDYKQFVDLVEPLVKRQLVDHPYNTIGGFLKFHRVYRQQSGWTLAEFFRRYDPPIDARHHTCVGLGLDLVERVRQSYACRQEFADVGDRLFLASCQEECEDAEVDDITACSPPDQDYAFKEHVVVALRITVGGRPGVVVLDTGYHVSRVVTVMVDQEYPHTGWFVHSRTPKMTKHYNYQMFGDHDYVQWQVRHETPSGVSKLLPSNLIYVRRAFLGAVDVAERLSLVYTFKALVTRNEQGEVKSGLYCCVKRDAAVTLFYEPPDGGVREECKIPLTYFRAAAASSSAAPAVNVNFERIIDGCQASFQQQATTCALRPMLVELADILGDDNFIQDIFQLNQLLDD